MADMASTIRLEVSKAGIYHTNNVKQETADKVSALCNENHSLRHCFYNEIGEIFEHNHIVHHLLTLFSLGATPEISEEMYKRDCAFQAVKPPYNDSIAKSLHNPAIYLKYVGQHMHYPEFLDFFEREIARKGVPETVNRYVFAGDEIAEDMFGRLFQGFLHPLIHFGLGLDFDQPAIIAEALAQGVSHHDEWLTEAMQQCEKISNARSDHVSMVQMMHEIGHNEKILSSRQYDTWEKLSEGTLRYAKDECTEFASRWIVQPTDEDIALKAAELMNASVFAIAANQKPDKLARFDFLLIHIPNSAIFMCTIAKLPWIANEYKARLLSWYGRLIIILFGTFGARPKLSLEPFERFKGLSGGSAEAIQRGINHPDDCHGVKLVRAILFAAEVSKEYEHRPEFAVKGEHFPKILQGVVESFNPHGGKAGMNLAESWIRFTAWDEAWRDVPNVGEPPQWIAKGFEAFPKHVKIHDWVYDLKPASACI